MMQSQPTHYKWISFFVVLLVALSIAAPVLADYLGPNRTVTTTVSVCKVVLKSCMYVESKGEYRYHVTDSWSCSNESKPWQAYPSNGGACPPGKDHWERDESVQEITVTYDPATIVGSVQNCTLQNGWCVTSPALALSANEPLSGYSITLIEGTLNGGTFACPNGATSCTVPFNEGENNFNYWALSSWGDSSTMGSSAARVDTVAPSVGLDIRGVSGLNGWYVSPLTITATGADATSGVASMLLSVDGGATWQPALILNEGVYNAAVTVADYAGNVSSSTTTLSVDTTTPSINMSVAGTLGHNGWYKSAIQVSAAASDATSGVATFEVSADGAAYQSYAPIAFNDGPHTIQFKAVDAAGNVTETASQTFYVDTLAPTVNLPSSWQLGTNVPYDVIDEGSGLAALRIVIEDEDEKYAKVAWNQEVSGSTYSQDIDWNGQFKDKTVAPPGTYLVWLKASDLAGNERFQLGKVIVPEPNLFLSLLPTEEPSAILPSPPAELSEPETVLPVTAPPVVGFGGETTQPGETTKQSVLLATGTAGAASTTTTSSVLWGAMAVAASAAATAYALDATRKRKEAEEPLVKAQIVHDKAERAEKRLTREEKQKRAEEHDRKVQERKERQSWANPAKEKELLKQQKERDQAYQALLQQQAQAQAAANARMAEKMTKLEKQEETAWVAAQAAIQKKQEDKKVQDLQPKLTGYFNSEQQGPAKVVAAPVAQKDPPPPKESFWDKFKRKVEEVKQLVNDKIVEPAKDAAHKVVVAVKNKVEDVKQKLEEAKQWVVTKYEETKKTVQQKLEETKQWVVTKYEETKKTVQQKLEETKKWAITKYEETKKTLKQKLEETKQWVDTRVVQPAKNTFNKIVADIKLYFSPVATLPRDPALRPIESFHQDQKSVTTGTSGVECVTTTAVMVRNIMNEYLAHLSNQTQLPDLTVKDHVLQMDKRGFVEWFSRVPSNTPPLLGIPIGGWMHPKLQMRNELNVFASEFEQAYGCSYTIQQSSWNSYNDIARAVREGKLVIIHGMWDPDATQAWIGGGPHTLGPVISMDANSITILDTGTDKTHTFTKDEFMEFWGKSSQVQVPGAPWLKLTPFFTYTPPNTMTVITPDTVCSPVTASTNTPVSSPTGTPTLNVTPSPTGTPSTAPTNTPISLPTGTPPLPTSTSIPASSPTSTPTSTPTP